MSSDTPRTNPADAVIPPSPAYDQTDDGLVLPKNRDEHPVISAPVVE